MTNPLDPALFRPDAVTSETRTVNDSLVQLLTPMSDWWVTGAQTRVQRAVAATARSRRR